jgi:hypothetical protein
MTQQVEVTVKLTLEVDCTRQKSDIEDYVNTSFLLAHEDYFDFIKLDIIEVKEEKYIYDNK